MAIDITITVEDITAKLLLYESIQLERSATVGGSYSLVATETLVDGDFYYVIEDSGGDLNKWYRYRFYHSTGPVASGYSAPFRVEGVTLLRVRQKVLDEYNCGVVLLNTNTDASKVTTIDPEVKGTLYSDGRGKGTYLLVATGNRAGDERMIVASDVSEGDLTPNSAFGGALANGDEVEWHKVVRPSVLNSCIRRALARCWMVDRIPIQGVEGDDEYPIEVPWLTDRQQIHDVRWYPYRTAGGVDDSLDQPWGVQGRWWGTRQDGEIVTLLIRPTITSSEVLYLECTRPMPPIWTDASAAPAIASEELIAAVAYDEVLAWLSRPGTGSVEDRKAYVRARRSHKPDVHTLLVKHRPKPRHGPPQLAHPPVVPQPYKAR